jgi:hypothetical protein
VATIVGQQREVMLQGCRRNQQIHIADQHTRGAQSPPLPAKDFGGCFVDADDTYALKEIVELLLALDRITRGVDALREFCQCYTERPSPSG